MSDDLSRDELNRYVEYLQKQLATEGWESVFNHNNLKEWYSKKSNIDRLRSNATRSGFDSSLVEELERSVLDFETSTKFDHPETQQIFVPIFEQVQNAAKKIGLQPIQEVRLVSTADVSVTPAARPQAGMHMLFIGRGTSSFCNYWAKGLAQFVLALAGSDPNKRFLNADDITKAIEQTPASLILPVRLANYYSFFGTLLGFGKVILPPPCLMLRGELLGAMESFIVAHEYAHFVAEERIPKFQGQLSRETSRELEMFCDELGLQICREVGNQKDSYFEFTGVGSVIFLRVVEICHLAQIELMKIESKICQNDFADTHPDTGARIDAIKDQIRLKTAPEQKSNVTRFVEEYDCILCMLKMHVLELLRSAMESMNETEKTDG